MQLSDGAGRSLTLAVTGYEFPDAADPRTRYSWYLVTGSVVCPEGSWVFTDPALTCGESPWVSRWLRAAADRLDPAANAGSTGAPPLAALTFTEPNLVFTLAAEQPGLGVVEDDLDHECRPPWDRSNDAPFTLRLATTPVGLRAAADAWDDQRRPYPGPVGN